jgi:thiamine-monophosphate kinase
VKRPPEGDPIALGAGAEFDAIRAMIVRWGTRARGLGDDAAVLQVPRGDSLVASVDSAVEGRHFQREWFSAREIGYRAVAAALSDLAAMAARPLGVLVAVTIPAEWRQELDELAEGIGEAASASGAPIVGGNTTDGDALSITTTVLGTAFSVLRRDAVRDGDNMYLTGRLGGPAAALRALRGGKKPDLEHRDRLVHPTPRIREARWLAERGAHAAIDVSDGLAADLGHLAAASGVGIEVDLDCVPRVSSVSALDAAASGEEYELVVAAAGALDAVEFERTFGIPLTVIGRARAGEVGVMLSQGGARVANPPGYDHLSR